MAGQQSEVSPLILPGNIQLVWCPPGKFLMGSSAENPYANFTEMPQHEVILTTGFWIGITPITVEQWEQVMPYSILLHSNCPHVPAEGMTWEQANTFCEKLTLQLQLVEVIPGNQAITLPTEAQCEYACRAGTITNWYFGDNETLLDAHAWYFKNSNYNSHNVGTKQPNPWGIYDLYGNVMEWCLDDFSNYASIQQPCIDPLLLTEKHDYKVLRGGSFYAIAENCRSAARIMSNIINSYNDPIGLRIVINSKST